MCLWILTACLGLLPGNPSPAVVVPAAPSPIIVPTAAPTTTTTATTTTTSTTTTTTTTTTPAPTTIPTTVPTQPPTTITTTTPPPTTLPPTTTTTTPAPTTTTPPPVITTVNPNINGFLVPLVICSNPTVVCLYNPNESTTGPLPIDPRLGTTPPSAAIRLPPISGYSAPLPSSDSAVKFPRSRRNVSNKKMKIIPDVFNIIKKTEGIHNITKRQSCACVLVGTCIRNLIDIRIVTPPGQCPAGQEYCCGNATEIEPSIVSCGVRQEVPPSSVIPAPGQASFGEFPWQGAVITVENFYGGGVLIDGLNVLTVAHKTEFSEVPVNLTVRLGEYDGNTPDPVPYQEYLVSKVFRHPSYNPNTLQKDIAVLRLASAVPFSPTAGSAMTINRACLPPSATSDYTGQRCLVAGWGFQVFGPEGFIQTTIKKVDVPIIDPETCQSLLRTTRLGPDFTLDSDSFICAGGEEDKDACTGDGGSGLVCEVDGKWVLVGLVAWGLGCGDANVPGVYVNVANFLPWINEQIAAP